MTQSGGLRVFFAIDLGEGDPKQVWDQIRQTLPSRIARRGDNVYAELLSQQAIIAPSQDLVDERDGASLRLVEWVTLRGCPDEVPVISVAELREICSLLEVTSDPALAGASDAQEPSQNLSARARAVRRSYLRHVATNEHTLALLAEAGWTVLQERGDEIALIKPGSSSTNPHGFVGGDRRPRGGFMNFSTAAELADGYWDPFALLAVLKYGGSGEYCAEDLLARGVVQLPPRALAAAERPLFSTVGKQPTNRLAEELAAAMAKGAHPTIPDIPMFLAQVVPDGDGIDRFEAVVSLTPEGVVYRWVDNEQLALAAVQPGWWERTEKGSVLHISHTVPKAICEIAMTTVSTGHVLPAARYISRRPILTAEGQVVSTPGWNPKARALLALPLRDRHIWDQRYHVPPEPTVQDVHQSTKYLVDDVLVDFPFASPGDRARALVCLLSHAARDLTPTQPAFVLDAADRGSGKTLFASVSRIIASGSERTVSVGHRRGQDEESIKQVVAGALEGCRYVHIDELPREEKVTSTFLSELVTAPGGVRKRRLGVNENVHVPGVTLTIAGNNAEVGGDWTRRIIPVRMVHRGGGLPHERTSFRHPQLLAWVYDHQPELLAAVHTILLRSLQQQHEPVAGFGSFEGWSALVVAGLSEIELDGENIAELVYRDRSAWAEEQDDLSDQWGALFTWWCDQVGDEWLTAKQLHKKVDGAGPPLLLPERLDPVAGETPSAVTRRWGKALGELVDTGVLSGDHVYRLERQRRGSRGAMYRVTRTANPDAVDPEPSDDAKDDT